MKYLDRASFQVGGYTRAYADNWQAIFGEARAKLDAEKAQQESQEPHRQDATAQVAGSSDAV